MNDWFRWRSDELEYVLSSVDVLQECDLRSPDRASRQHCLLVLSQAPCPTTPPASCLPSLSLFRFHIYMREVLVYVIHNVLGKFGGLDENSSCAAFQEAVSLRALLVNTGMRS
jgi:hypothetical protein